MQQSNSLVSFFNLGKYKYLLASIGPGLVVMLADTEAGSVITAAQSGAQWGHRLLILQFLLIPILYVVQELAVRIALSTGKGYSELVREHFGRFVSFLSMTILIISCIGALITEMSGLGGVGQLFGVPLWITITMLILLILVMITTGSYHSVERTAVLLGIFELSFLVVAVKSHPDTKIIFSQITDIPLTNHDYLYLVAANIGTSIMPWTVSYQQSAIVDKKLGIQHLKIARFDTLIGAIICQIVTASILIAAADAFGYHRQVSQLENIPQIAIAFTDALGSGFGKIVFALGLTGGALVATIVVCLTAAWSIGETIGLKHSLEKHPLDAPLFYGFFTIMLIISGILVVLHPNLIKLTIAIGVLNAFFLPIILFFLYHIATTELPSYYKLKGKSAIFTVAIFFLISIASVGSSLLGIIS